MQISFLTNHGDLHLNGGYGIASYNIITSLQKLGVEVPWDNAEAEKQLNFCFPSYFADHLRPDQHSIWLAVWESTKLQPDWYDIIDEVDEIWTASDWCKNMLEDNGYKVNRVYPHGVDPVWKPYKRPDLNVMRFLFDGEPVTRKNGQFAHDAFKAAFGDSQDVELIIKSKGPARIRKYDSRGQIIGIPDGNVKIITSVYEQENMVSLYHSAHCLVAPTAGEGWGLPPIQALATGIPAIATAECLHYRDKLQNLGLSSKYIDSPWPDMHPGQVLQPDFDDLVDKYRYVYENYDSISTDFYKQSFKIHNEYDWESLTKKAFEIE